jgi:type IV pilus assembly protein PilB
VRYGYVQPPLLERARAFQKTRPITLSRALVELKLVTAEGIRPLLEEVSGVRAVDPSLMTVYPDYLQSVSQLIPPEFVVKALLFPVQSEINTVHVCMLNPTDRTVVVALEALSGCRISPLVGQEIHLAGALTQHYEKHLKGPPTAPTNAEDIRRLAHSLIERRLATPMESYLQPAVALVNRNRDRLAAGDPGALDAVLRDPALIQMVHQMVTRLVYRRASDIHFEPLDGQFRVRSRVDGSMTTLWSMPPALALATVARLKVMAGLPPAASRTPLDARISYELVWGKEIDFRFSALPNLHGEKVVLRTLDRSRKRQGLNELGFDPETYERVRAVVEGPNGLVLVTGPTGSGKTSTLYALVDHLNHDDVNIVTAEDPIESRIEGVTQVQCGEDAGLSFADALRSFLRQDPDIILVGETRDQETADIALKAALTGHLVFSTLHTNDAPSTILRLLNMGLDPFLVASAVRLVIAQRLLRKLCPDCRKPDPGAGDGRFRGLAEREVAILKGAKLFVPGGCEACGQTGYRGRTGIFEALTMNERLEELVASAAPVAQIREAAQKAGMKNLREGGLRLAAAGVTSVEEAIVNTVGEMTA